MLAKIHAFSPSTQLAIVLGSIYFYIGIFAPFFPLWLTARGLNPSEVGLVLAAPIVVRVISNPLILSLASQKQAVDETMVWCALASLAGFVGLVFCHSFWPLLIVTGLTFLFQGSMMPLSDVMILNQVARNAKLHYGSIRSWGSVSVLAGMLIAGALAGVLPGEAVIWMLVLSAIAQALICTALLSKAGGHAKPIASKAPSRDMKRLDLVLIVIVAAALVQCSHAMISGFSSILYHSRGYSDFFIGWAWGGGVFTEILMFMVAGRYLGGANNAYRFFMVGCVSCVIRWVVSSMDLGAAGIILTQGSHGLTFCATHLGTMYLLARMVPSGRLAQMQGIYAGTTSLFTAAMTALSGPIFQHYSGHGLLVMIVPVVIGMSMMVYVYLQWRRGLTP